MSRLFEKSIYDKFILIVFFISGFILNGFLGVHYAFLLFFTFFIFVYLVLNEIKIKSSIILLYFFSLFLSWALSYYKPNSYSFIVELSSIFIVAYAMSKSENLSLLLFLKIVFYIIAFLVFLDYLSYKYFSFSFIFTSRNQNYQAFFYLIAFGFLIKEKTNFIKIFFLVFITALIFLIKSRIGLVSVTLLILIRIFRVKDKFNLFFVLLLLLLFVLISVNYFDILKLSDSKSYKRLYMYLSSIKALLSNPFTGWGVGSFEYVFEFFKFPYYDGLNFYSHSLKHAHSHLLNIFVEGGVISGFLIIMVLYYTLRYNFDYIFIGIIPFFLFDSIFLNPFIRMLFFLFIGFNLKEDFVGLSIKRFLPLLIVFFISFTYYKEAKDFKKYHDSYGEILLTENKFRIYAVSEYSYFYNPNNVIFLYLYSHLKGNRIDTLKKILSLEPNFTQAQLELCELYLRLKDKNFFECFKNIKIDKKCRLDDFYSFFLCNYDRSLYESLKKNLNNY